MSTGNGQQASPAFREQEVAQLFHWIKDGESASVIGVSNIGKSNLFQHLMDPATRKDYLEEEACKYLFLRINFHNLPDFSCRSVYSLILDQMEMLDKNANDVCLPEEALAAIGKYHEAMLDSGQDELKIQRYFKLALRMYLLEPGRRLVLLFDQFDLLYQKAGEQLFYNLRGLRDMYKYRVSYLVFTRDPLPDLPVDVTLQGTLADDENNEEDRDTLLFGDNGDKAREEFYELLQSNPLYLKPYQPEDAERLLRSVARRKQLPLEERWIRPLYDLTGGHAGLLRMCYPYAASRWAKNGIDADPTVMLENDPVRQECRRIWASLSDDEQTALVVQIRNPLAEDIDHAACAKLKQKGMLREDGQVFSTLFEQFARDQKTRLDRMIYLDTSRRVVYYHGQRSKQLSKTEYVLFKKLYDRRNSVVSHEELLHACWPHDDYDDKNSPPAITAHIHRIRRKLGISDKDKSDKLIEAKTGYGYILNTESSDKKAPLSSAEDITASPGKQMRGR